MNDRIQSTTGFQITYNIADTSAPFLHRSSMVKINGLTVVATASTPLQVEVSDAEQPAMLIPFSGKSHTFVDSTRHDWNAGEAAILLPATGRQGHDTTRSALFIMIDPERIQNSARSMLGLEPGNDVNFLALERPRSLALKVGGLALGNQFRQHGQIIDQLSQHEKLLDRSGLDEVIYRAMVTLLIPERLTVSSVAKTLPHGQLSDLCDFITANLEKKLTMTDLEKFAGISSRALQYAFRKHFNCTPKEWVIEQKLCAVRNLLLHGNTETRVTEQALMYFSNLGDFSRQYRRKFGELPSQTLARSRS